jgi:hypothetical protein
MSYDQLAVINRDGRRCRLRFRGCTGHAKRVILDVPEYLGGPCEDANARAACDHCADQQQHQRSRVSTLFGN